MHCVASRLAIARTAPAPSVCTFFFEALSFFLFVRVASLSFSFACRAEQRGGVPAGLAQRILHSVRRNRQRTDRRAAERLRSGAGRFDLPPICADGLR
jgi:hypothetical protein